MYSNIFIATLQGIYSEVLSVLAYMLSTIFVQGRPSPLRPWCIFPPCFRFPPLFSKNLKILWKIWKILPFPEKISDFHPPKFLMTFFSHRPQILNFPPILPLLVHFPPWLAKIIISPLLSQISPLFSENSPAFYILSVYFPPTLTMMYLCITQCTYWTPLYRPIFNDRPYPTQFSFGYVPFNITCAINVPCRLSL